MSQPELLKRLVLALDVVGIPYMLTGSVVSSLQGEPRSTHDIDVIVELDRTAADRLAQMFPESQFYWTDIAIREALAHRSMFSIMDNATGDKIDLWLLTDEPFNQSRFARRQPTMLFGIKVFVSRPEDTIVQKLRWAAMSGGSEKHLRDALGVYEVHREGLDRTYIDRWTDQLGLMDSWRRLQAEARPE